MNSNRSQADPLRPLNSIIYSTGLLSKLTRKKRLTKIAHAQLEEEDFCCRWCCRLVHDNYSCIFIINHTVLTCFASMICSFSYIVFSLFKVEISKDRVYICFVNPGLSSLGFNKPHRPDMKLHLYTWHHPVCVA